jgi:hypothetical protein
MSKLEIQWSRDAKNGDLVGSVSFTGPDGNPATFIARANEALIHSRLVKRYAPALAKMTPTHSTAAGLPPAVANAHKRYVVLAGALARHQIATDLDKALRGNYVAMAGASNSPGQQLMAAISNPMVQLALNSALSALLGPAAVVSKLAPLVLDATSKVIARADKSEPTALGYVANLVAQAQRGDSSAAAMTNLIKVLKAPLSSAPKPAPVAPPSALPPLPPLPTDVPAARPVPLTPQQLPPVPQPSAAALPFVDYEGMLRNIVVSSGEGGEIAISGEPQNPMLNMVAEVSGGEAGYAGAALDALKRPTETQLAQALLRKAAAGHKKSILFLGAVAKAAKAHDQPAVRMQTILTNAAQQLNTAHPTVARAAAGGEYAISGARPVLPDDLVSRLSYIDEVLRQQVTPKNFAQPIDVQKINAWWQAVGKDHRQMRRADWTAMHDFGPQTADPNNWYPKQVWYWNEKSAKNRETYRGMYLSSDGILSTLSHAVSDMGDVVKETVPGAGAVSNLVQGKKVKLGDFAPKAVHDVINVAEKIAAGKKLNVTDVINTIVPGASSAQKAMGVVHSVPGLYSLAMMVPGLNVALPAIDLGLQAISVAEGGKFKLGSLLSALPFVSSIPGVGAVLQAAQGAGLDKIGDVIDFANKSGLVQGASALANVVSTVNKVTGGKAVPAGTNMDIVHALSDQHINKQHQAHVTKLVAKTAVAALQAAPKPAPHPAAVHHAAPKPVHAAPKPAPLPTEGGMVQPPSGQGYTDEVSRYRQIWLQGGEVPEYLRRGFEAEQLPPVSQEILTSVWAWLNTAAPSQVQAITTGYQNFAAQLAAAQLPMTTQRLAQLMQGYLTVDQLTQLQAQSPDLAYWIDPTQGQRFAGPPDAPTPVMPTAASGMRAGDAVAWMSGLDPAEGLAVSGLAAYVPPGERELRASKTMQKALAIMRNVKAGQQAARMLVAQLRQKHSQGDVTASAMLWFLHQAYLMLGGQPSMSTAAAGGSVAYGTNAWNPTPMSLQNFYTISGMRVAPFYAPPSMSLPGIGDNVITPEAEIDVIIGASGEKLKKVWNGKRWVWSEAVGGKVPQPFSVRPKKSGVRDTMLQGMQAMQRRQLSI